MLASQKSTASADGARGEKAADAGRRALGEIVRTWTTSSRSRRHERSIVRLSEQTEAIAA